MVDGQLVLSSLVPIIGTPAPFAGSASLCCPACLPGGRTRLPAAPLLVEEAPADRPSAASGVLASGRLSAPAVAWTAIPGVRTNKLCSPPREEPSTSFRFSRREPVETIRKNNTVQWITWLGGR